MDFLTKCHDDLFNSKGEGTKDTLFAIRSTAKSILKAAPEHGLQEGGHLLYLCIWKNKRLGFVALTTVEMLLRPIETMPEEVYTTIANLGSEALLNICEQYLKKPANATIFLFISDKCDNVVFTGIDVDNLPEEDE